MADGPPLLQILRRPPAGDETAPQITRLPEVVQRMREYAARRQPAAEEVCELCSAAVDEEHGHLVNVAARALLCVCRPCYLLFAHGGAGGGRFRAVPQRYEIVTGIAHADQAWEMLDVPIGLAFFFRSSTTGRTTAFYPSPAGATESELPLSAWEELTRAVPQLATLLPDVEALLVRSSNGPGGAPPAAVARSGVQALIVPIDACYELVGRIRRAWQGLQGGDDVAREIESFFVRAATRGEATR